MAKTDLRILVVQTRYALLVAVRNSRVIVFGLIFPAFLLVLFDSIFTSGKDATTHFGGGVIDTKAYFTAGLASYAIMLQTFTSLLISVTTQRETGQLKRLRGTPMPTWTFIGAYLLRSIVLVVAMVTLLFAIGVVGFGVRLHGAGLVGMVVYVTLGTATFATLGIAMTILTPTVDGASSVGPFAAVILSFISGVFLPLTLLPHWLRSVGQFFPLYHLSDGLHRSVVRGTGATGLDATDLLVLAAWAGVGIVLAVRRFRWEPQGAGRT